MNIDAETEPNLDANVVGVPHSLVPSALVPVGVAPVAHEAAHVVAAVLRGLPGFAKLAHWASETRNNATEEHLPSRFSMEELRRDSAKAIAQRFPLLYDAAMTDKQNHLDENNTE